MAHLLTHYWRILSDSFDRASERRFLREARRAMNACTCDAPRAVTRWGEEASRAERLQSIALFAQAGYFNMGNAINLFEPPPF
ncbi:hypothetical protein [Caballeronia grimmiae]|uniref:Uncharacterized protein n=1 Tax=Caballeronia grimmiae TaxID=1071679 RepID=A0A069NSE3_9BURK|nr:hypothetical protein [Caballeronia grimmiae]KDR30534.1 hypothetical protein BG57_14780 [Caballeronia grimmiae]GGD75096.1 hypothetical protein GCM10010985_31990 [Caballeronia grimmiae]